MLKCGKIVDKPVRKFVGKLWEKLWISGMMVSFTQKVVIFCTRQFVLVESFTYSFTHGFSLEKAVFAHFPHSLLLLLLNN